MRIHPAAQAIPAMLPDEYIALKADIEARGLLVPIETHNGQLLDGRHRFQACKELGIEPDVVEVTLNGTSPAEYVWSVNGIRRHLTPSQRAAVAVELLPEFKKAAKERQVRKPKSVPEKIPEQDKGEARDQAAALVGVNPRYVSDAEKIKRESPGEWFKLGAQLYFYGWANAEETEFAKWFLMDIAKYKMLVEQKGGLSKLGKLRQNQRHGRASFYAIPVKALMPCFVTDYRRVSIPRPGFR
ncbi:MAG: ParB/RepB/Spo0J family partition protein [Pseudomonadota bacterium]